MNDRDFAHAILEDLHSIFKNKDRISCYKLFGNVHVSSVSIHRKGRLDSRIVDVKVIDDTVHIVDMFKQLIAVFDIKDPNFPQSLYDWIDDEIC